MTQGPARDATAEVAGELAAERMATLSRLQRRLESSLAAWRLVEHRDAVPVDERRAILDDVAAAVWEVAVQRECMVLPGNALAALRAHYDLPAGAVARVGTVRTVTRVRTVPTGIPPLARRLVQRLAAH